MMVEYVGALVRVRLNNGKLVEGRVMKITPTLLALTDLPPSSKSNTVELSSSDIADVDIVSLPSKSHSPDSESKPVTIMRRGPSPETGTWTHVPVNNSPPQTNGLNQEFNHIRPSRKGEAFSVPVNAISEDFDFQSSNKLFRKDAVFEEWRQQDGVIPKHSNPDKLKPTEMVLSAPAAPAGANFTGDFLTDDQVPVTGLSLQRRVALFKRAIGAGLNYGHVVSVAGLAIAQMAIQVLGGSCRISARNHNNPPVAVVLVGGGDSGKVALTTALHLAHHAVHVRALVCVKPKGCDGLLSILAKEKCVVERGVGSLPGVVDIIIDGTQDKATLLSWPGWLGPVVEWTKQSPAPILAVDPQQPEETNKRLADAKWTCAIGAPLLHQGQGSGRLFLVDIGLFPQAFSDEHIPYTSPFFDKFVIPLHRTLK